LSKRARAAFKAGCFYASWYPRQWLPLNSAKVSGMDAKLAKHMRYAARTSRKLSRSLFHAMARFGPKLERQQVLLGRFVDIGAELFAMKLSNLSITSATPLACASRTCSEIFIRMRIGPAIESRKKFWKARRIGCSKESCKF
jgi:hypothetical protein